MNGVMLGAPGSGKGTQGARLAARLGIPHIASGDLFRKAVAEGTPLGVKVQPYLDEGAFVPDDITAAVILERLAEPVCNAGFLLDGFPRNLTQAQILDEALDHSGRILDVVVYLKVSEDRLLARLAGRFTCRNCQPPYNSASNPPRQTGICDRCGGQLYQRTDDRPEVARRRFGAYFELTEPLTDYYRQQAKLVEVDAEGAIDEVTAALAHGIQQLKQ